MSQWEGGSTCRHFSLVEIQSATQNFDESLVIGRGGFGKVYRGSITAAATGGGGVAEAAIKRLDAKSKQGAKEFWAEVEMLSKLRHCHLVSLIGYCNDGEEMILVYEYIPNGTLEDRLQQRQYCHLPWLQRIRICIGAARGLDYLHVGTCNKPRVIHRDVKSSNILLDENWVAKISDFGLSKIGPSNQPQSHVSTAVKGTFGYLDPEYFTSCRLTRKSDVYAFGVVMLEALCGRRAVDTTLDDEEKWGLAGWARECIKERRLEEIIDSGLRGQISPRCLKMFAQTAYRCLHHRSKQRPTMAEVVFMLERALLLQERGDAPDRKMTLIARMQCLFHPMLKFDGKVLAAIPPEDAVGGESGEQVLVHSTDIADAAATRVSAASRNLVFCDGSYGFTLAELLRSSFEMLGKSAYWGTYKARLESGWQVIIKRELDGHLTVDDRYIAGLGNLCHPNILALRAYYWSPDEKLFIYDYMPTGSIESLLDCKEGAVHRLPPHTDMIMIIMGITRGLLYLHKEMNIVHGNLKLSNILLDKNYTPLIADAGLSPPMMSNSSNVRTTAPELLEDKSPNKRTDIYSLGVIMLELLIGKSIGDGYDVFDLLHWGMRELSREWLDPKPEKESSTITLNEILQAHDLALLCIQTSPEARPDVQQVLQKLLQIRSEMASMKC